MQGHVWPVIVREAAVPNIAVITAIASMEEARGYRLAAILRTQDHRLIRPADIVQTLVVEPARMMPVPVIGKMQAVLQAPLNGGLGDRVQ